jgi:hypothetical protein
VVCSAGGDGGRRSLEHDDLKRWCGACRFKEKPRSARSSMNSKTALTAGFLSHTHFLHGS